MEGVMGRRGSGEFKLSIKIPRREDSPEPDQEVTDMLSATHAAETAVSSLMSSVEQKGPEGLRTFLDQSDPSRQQIARGREMCGSWNVAAQQGLRERTVKLARAVSYWRGMSVAAGVELSRLTRSLSRHSPPPTDATLSTRVCAALRQLLGRWASTRRLQPPSSLALQPLSQRDWGVLGQWYRGAGAVLTVLQTVRGVLTQATATWAQLDTQQAPPSSVVLRDLCLQVAWSRNVLLLTQAALNCCFGAHGQPAPQARQFTQALDAALTRYEQLQDGSCTEGCPGPLLGVMWVLDGWSRMLVSSPAPTSSPWSQRFRTMLTWQGMQLAGGDDCVRFETLRAAALALGSFGLLVGAGLRGPRPPSRRSPPPSPDYPLSPSQTMSDTPNRHGATMSVGEGPHPTPGHSQSTHPASPASSTETHPASPRWKPAQLSPIEPLPPLLEEGPELQDRTLLQQQEGSSLEHQDSPDTSHTPSLLILNSQTQPSPRLPGSTQDTQGPTPAHDPRHWLFDALVTRAGSLRDRMLRRIAGADGQTGGWVRRVAAGQEGKDAVTVPWLLECVDILCVQGSIYTARAGEKGASVHPEWVLAGMRRWVRTVAAGAASPPDPSGDHASTTLPPPHAPTHTQSPSSTESDHRSAPVQPVSGRTALLGPPLRIGAAGPGTAFQSPAQEQKDRNGESGGGDGSSKGAPWTAVMAACQEKFSEAHREVLAAHAAATHRCKALLQRQDAPAVLNSLFAVLWSEARVYLTNMLSQRRAACFREACAPLQGDLHVGVAGEHEVAEVWPAVARWALAQTREACADGGWSRHLCTLTIAAGDRVQDAQREASTCEQPAQSTHRDQDVNPEEGPTVQLPAASEQLRAAFLYSSQCTVRGWGGADQQVPLGAVRLVRLLWYLVSMLPAGHSRWPASRTTGLLYTLSDAVTMYETLAGGVEMLGWQAALSAGSSDQTPDIRHVFPLPVALAALRSAQWIAGHLQHGILPAVAARLSHTHTRNTERKLTPQPSSPSSLTREAAGVELLLAVGQRMRDRWEEVVRAHISAAHGTVARQLSVGAWPPPDREVQADSDTAPQGQQPQRQIPQQPSQQEEQKERFSVERCEENRRLSQINDSIRTAVQATRAVSRDLCQCAAQGLLGEQAVRGLCLSLADRVLWAVVDAVLRCKKIGVEANTRIHRILSMLLHTDFGLDNLVEALARLELPEGGGGQTPSSAGSGSDSSLLGTSTTNTSSTTTTTDTRTASATDTASEAPVVRSSQHTPATSQTQPSTGQKSGGWWSFVTSVVAGSSSPAAAPTLQRADSPASLDERQRLAARRDWLRGHLVSFRRCEQLAMLLHPQASLRQIRADVCTVPPSLPYRYSDVSPAQAKRKTGLPGRVRRQVCNGLFWALTAKEMVHVLCAIYKDSAERRDLCALLQDRCL